MEDPVNDQEEFVRRLTAAQASLHAYISSLMAGSSQAQDVLQETNLKLWRRAAEYDRSRPFLPWAFALARWEVMAWRKTQQRSRLVLDDDLVERVAEYWEEKPPQAEKELGALASCLGKLPSHQREIIEARYQRGETVRAMAARTGQGENNLAALFYRIRRTLNDCITATLGREEKA